MQEDGQSLYFYYPQVDKGPLLWTFAADSGLHQIPTLTLMASHCGPLTVVLCKKYRRTAPNPHTYSTTPPRRDPRISQRPKPARARDIVAAAGGVKSVLKRSDAGPDPTHAGRRPPPGPTERRSTVGAAFDSQRGDTQARRHIGAATHQTGSTTNGRYTNARPRNPVDRSSNGRARAHATWGRRFYQAFPPLAAAPHHRMRGMSHRRSAKARRRPFSEES
jgi:hypothetical protein